MDEPSKLAACLKAWRARRLPYRRALLRTEDPQRLRAVRRNRRSGLADGTLSARRRLAASSAAATPSAARSCADAGRPFCTDAGRLDLIRKFMEKICPGLPDWTALNKPECIQALSTPETAPNGRFLDYPADWGSRAATILADNTMQYTAVPAGSEGALVAELEASEAAKSPLVMMFWGPHYALAENDVGWITMPPCKVKSNDHCITPPDVDKIVWSGFGAKWPTAYAFLKTFKMDATEQQKLMLAVDKQGKDLDAVVKEWVDKNEVVWKPWVDAAK